MYTLTVQSGFSAAHYLVDYPGPCQQVHGHNYNVELTIAASTLDESGMVIDLMELKKVLDDCLSPFDHHLLNKVPPFDRQNPTSENLARYIFEYAEERLKSKVQVVQVRVMETERFTVSYSRV